MIVPEAVAAADSQARRLLRGHYENFWVSSPLVPRRLRPHLARIYAYCRMTDDLGDEQAGDAEQALRAWREEVLRCFTEPPSARDPFLGALSSTIRTFALPPQLFLDLIEANLQDQRVTQYANDDQLIGYCRLSAAPVGRMVLRLYGIDDPDLDRLSDDVCIGLQLANFVQDVRVDADKGRTYLVQSELQRAGVAGAIQSMCDRAAALLKSGLALEAAVPYRLRVQLSLYRGGGEAIIAAVRGGGYRSDQRRPEVSNVQKTGLLISGLTRSVWRRTDAHQYRPA